MAPQTERIVALETHRFWHWAALGAIGVWLSWASITLIGIKGDMQALKQKVKDGGLGDIVSDMKSPRSPAELQASLYTVIAQVQTARVRGQAPDEKKVRALSDAVSLVVQKNPHLPEAWQAASELISYRTSGEPISNESPCKNPDSIGAIDTHKTWSPNDQNIPVVVYKDCTIDIGDFSAYENGPLFKGMQSINKLYLFTFALDHVHVIYRGGPVIPASNFVFRNCTFDFQLNSMPPTQGDKITKTLLASEDLANVKVETPTS